MKSLNAFAKAWKILKAEIDFIEPGDKPEDIAYKRMWLYNDLDRTPEDNPDRYAEEGGWDAIPKWDLENEPEEKHKTYRQSYLDRYGHMVPSGQANTDYGYEQKQTYHGLQDDRSKPIFGEGRLLINLPGMTDTARWSLSEEYEKRTLDLQVCLTILIIQVILICLIIPVGKTRTGRRKRPQGMLLFKGIT